MMEQQTVAFEKFLIILVEPVRGLLFASCDKPDTTLPEVRIPCNARPAELVTSMVQERWNVSTLLIDWIPTNGERPVCAVLEVLAWLRPPLDSGLRAFSLDAAPVRHLPQEILETIISLLRPVRPPQGPFARFGWLADAERWLQNSSGEKSARIERVAQFNASATFCLARLTTDSNKNYWLKAVGHPNTHEFDRMAYLVEHHTLHLPAVISMRKEWNAWLMREHGASLHSSCSVSEYIRAAKGLAELQKETISEPDCLLAMGFADHRVKSLDSQIDGYVCFLEESMRLQTHTKVKVLSEQRLREIGILLHEACSALDDLNIPDCILHGDISPGSILSDGVRVVFTDWCEAYVGNPFLSIEQFCVHTRRARPELPQSIDDMKQAYGRRWHTILSTKQIDQAFRWIPLISVLSYLHGRGDWLHTAKREDPALRGYARGLARHMDRIVSDRAKERIC